MASGLVLTRRALSGARVVSLDGIFAGGKHEPESVTIDKSGANLAALEAINAERETPIKIRQTKYLNNIIEQDHRAIKRRTRTMLGFKKFRCARILLGGIEVTHMIADVFQDSQELDSRRKSLQTE
ncbi:hypothetical protein PTKU64_83020 [Paraburkholderia terrae]|uniref:DDE domain-containing protein n=1 Tax=Paraburkholderia terrae TaxID=311230 RepID=A0ABM7UAG7_9BURK|nr:hypothetical protein PTKU64_83020 [Paraburkholderia terrae]